MYKYNFMLLLCSFLTLPLVAQNDSLNMEKLAQWDDPTLPNSPGGTYNDCWGYTDAAGNEYAIIGGAENVFFFNITDPQNIQLIRKVNDGDPDIPGNVDLDPTTWRDFKTYGTKAYSCADQSSSDEGLIVYDLSQLPDTVLVEAQITSFFTKSHNIYIDESSGYLYTAGARVDNTHHFVIVLDLNADPIELLADVSISGGKIHDIHVVNDIAYCNSEFDGFYVYDFSMPTSPVFLGSLNTYSNSGYNHSGWLADDGIHYVFCDESVGSKVKIADVSDLNNLSNSSITDQFFSNLLDETATNPANIAHNPFIKDDLVYVAYYNDGVQVFDISDPTDVVREGYYDTHENTDYTTDKYGGVWGVYPFFASGSIIASDGENGLFVFKMIDGSLPVDLISFNAVQQQDKVRIEWATASEKNSGTFEIERSSDGENFTTLKRVAANNNSSERIDYEAFDEAPLAGENYYRLKQVDIDGAFEYSGIELVTIKTGAISISPTYVTSDQAIKITFDSGMHDLFIEVISINGQVLKSYTFDDLEAGDVEIPTDDLENGLYVFKIQYGQTSITEKIMVAR